MSIIRANRWETISGNSAGVLYVDTIDELQALPTSELVDGQQVQVKEYHAGTGVGGGGFYWDAVSTDFNNGGTTLSVSGVETGRWKRIYNSAPVNICWFGAIGDGVQRKLSDLYSTFSDAQKNHPSAVDFEDQVDSTAIQCAIDAHNQVYVPIGLFWQNRAVIRSSFSGDLLIYGDGPSSIVRRVPLTVDGSGGSNRMFNVFPAGDGEHHTVTVSNISLDHDASNQASPETGFGFEQSGVFRVVAVGKESVSVYASNLFFNDPVADCLNLASGSASNTFKTISVDKIFNSKRTRRRFDLTITGSYRTATIENCEVTSLRWEINSRDIDLPHDTLISNCRVSVSREPGAGGNAMYVITAPLSKTQITNCNIKGNIYFGGGADFLISNIDVEDGDEDPVSRLLSGSFNVVNSNFRLGSSGDACLYSDGGNTSPSGVTFNQCNFEFYGESANGNIRLRNIEPNPVKFVNCKIEQTSTSASRIIDNDNAGGLIIDGCTIVRNQEDASKSGIRELGGDIEIKDSSFVGDIHWLKPNRRSRSISITGSTFSNNEKIFNNTGEDGSLLVSDFAATRVDDSDRLQTPELGLLRGTALPTAGVWLPGWEFQVVTATAGEDYKFVSTTRSATPTWHAIGKLGE